MRQLILCLLAVNSLGCVYGEKAVQNSTVNQQVINAKADEKRTMMLIDQVDDTDVLAIPLDNSEIETETDIDQDNKANTFVLPHSY